MYNITYITSFLDIPIFAVYIITIIYSKYFTCLSDSNVQCLRGKSLSCVIGLLSMIFKQLATIIQETGSLLNSKPPSLHTPYTVVFLSLAGNIFSLFQLSSLHQKVFSHFASGY